MRNIDTAWRAKSRAHKTGPQSYDGVKNETNDIGIIYSHKPVSAKK